MRVLVTGGAGFIGRHVVDALLARGHAVVVVDRLDHGPPGAWPSTAVLHAADIRTWRPAAGDGVDAVVHLAAQAAVALGERRPVAHLDDNVGGTAAALGAAVALQARTFCLASSAAVYGNPADDRPLAETVPPEPQSVYGFSKWAAEELAALWHRTRGLDVTILRPANVYGPGQADEGEGGVVTRFTNSLRAGRPLRRFGDGAQTRYFVYVEDVAWAFVLAVEQTPPAAPALRVFNIGTGVSTSVNTLGEVLGRIAGRPLHWRQEPPRRGDIRHSRFDVSAAAAWGFRAETPLAEGLRRTWERHGP
jgi:UDP-glucose 4-epimerase